MRLLFEDWTDEVIGGTMLELVEVWVNGQVNEPVEICESDRDRFPVKQSGQVVLPGDDDLIERSASVFTRQVERRCPAKVTTRGRRL